MGSLLERSLMDGGCAPHCRQLALLLHMTSTRMVGVQQPRVCSKHTSCGCKKCMAIRKCIPFVAHTLGRYQRQVNMVTCQWSALTLLSGSFVASSLHMARLSSTAASSAWQRGKCVARPENSGRATTCAGSRAHG